MKKIIQFKLKILAKMILAKYKPEVIGITGSVGKTSAKEAVFAVLSGRYNVRRSDKNYNNEIGLPLTIIGEDSPGSSFIKWIFLFFKALKLIIFRDKQYPEILILEMGIDRPGDMDYLLSIVKCKIGILTKIGHSHAEFFNNINEIAREKGKLLRSLSRDEYAVINIDAKKIKESTEGVEAKIMSYGIDDSADVRVSKIEKYNNNIVGVKFEVVYKNYSSWISISGVLGEAIVEAALAAVAVGEIYGISLNDITDSLASLKTPNGRMKVIPGIKKTLVIDDSYNSSPQSSLLAIEALGEIKINPDSKKIAVLGDMLELGAYTREGHSVVGKKLAELNINKLVAVGERARDIMRGAIENGMSEENIFHFDTSEEARKFVQEIMREGDAILVKGSQGMRMEKIVKEIMADPLRAEEFLVRQDKSWDNK